MYFDCCDWHHSKYCVYKNNVMNAFSENLEAEEIKANKLCNNFTIPDSCLM